MASIQQRSNNPDEIQIELTQQEIWDDSTLVEAWDEALDEYKKYHSIAATGDNTEALIKPVENAGSKADETKSQQPEQEEAMNDAPAEDTQAGPEATEKDVQAAETLQAVTHAASIEIPEVPTYIAAPPEAPTGFPFAQQHPAGPAAGFAIGGNDEAMRSLMMAWYWAGYYTGLHEGQQKALQQPEQQ